MDTDSLEEYWKNNPKYALQYQDISSRLIVSGELDVDGLDLDSDKPQYLILAIPDQGAIRLVKVNIMDDRDIRSNRTYLTKFLNRESLGQIREARKRLGNVIRRRWDAGEIIEALDVMDKSYMTSIR